MCVFTQITNSVFFSLFKSVDGPEEKPRRLNSDEVQDGNENYSENQNDSSDVKPTPPTQKRKNLQMKKNERYLSSSPSLERLKIKVIT